MQERIAVIGLGYVGLPVALAFARKNPGTIGFDVNKEKVEELRRGFDRNQEVSEGELKETSLTITSDVADLKSATFFVVAVPTPVDHNNVPDLTPVVKASETVGKGADQGRRRRLRVDGLPGRHRGDLRSDPRQDLGPGAGQGLQARLLARAHQPGRQGAHARAHREGRLRRGRGDARSRRRRLRRDHRRGRPPRVLDQGRRGGQGHREHAARSQHRAHERAGDHLRSHGHPHRRRARGRGHEVELPQVPPRPGRRSLHRRRPVLPDDEGAAARLPARGDPRRPPHQQQRRAVPGAAAGQDADQAGLRREGRARRRARPDVQGRLQRPPQQQGARHPDRAAHVRHRAAHPRQPRQPRRGEARVRRHAEPARGVQEPRRAHRRGQPQGVHPAGPAQAAGRWCATTAASST